MCSKDGGNRFLRNMSVQRNTVKSEVIQEYAGKEYVCFLFVMLCFPEFVSYDGLPIKCENKLPDGCAQNIF